jgi:uncharacterized protein (TIGR03663 family)
MVTEEKDRQRSCTEAQLARPPWLTVETGLYVLLILIAGFLRFYGLGTQPLEKQEAQLALDVWRFYTGGAASIRGHSPLLFNGNALLYVLFGANDYVARVLPALAGTLVVGLPYLFRPYLGRRGSLVTGAILALSPSFVFFSRQLSGEVIVAASLLALVAGFFGYLRLRKESHLYLSAGALAVALTAGSTAYPALLALGGFFLAVALYSRYGDGEAPLLQGLSPPRVSERAWLIAGGVFAAVVLVIATGLLVNLHGLQATLDLLPTWLSQLSTFNGGQPWHYYLWLLVGYAPLVFVFGLAGAVYLPRRDLFSALLVCWFGVTLVFFSLMGIKPPSGLLQILLPLTLLAGRTIGDLLTKVGEGEQWLWDRVALLISIPVIFHMTLQLSAFADPQDPGDPTRLILVFLSLFFLVSVILITGTLASDWRGTIRTGGLISLLLLGSLMVQTTWRLNHYRPGNPLEVLAGPPTSSDVRNLVTAVEEYSNQQERDQHSVDITVQGEQDPILAWYLRDFTDLVFTSGSTSSPTPVVLTPLEEPLTLPEYRGARFRLQSAWQPEDLPGHELARWYLFRETLHRPAHRDIVMWVAVGPEE